MTLVDFLSIALQMSLVVKRVHDFIHHLTKYLQMSSGTRQLQQLVFFSDHCIIPEVKNVSEDGMIMGIISESQGTSAAWLVATLIENSLQGSANHINSELPRRAIKNPTTFVSFKRPAEFYAKLCKRNGVDLFAAREFKYIDLFTALFTKHIPNPSSRTVNADVTRMFETVSKLLPKKERSVVLVENPEILLTSTEITPNELLAHIDELSRLSSHVFIILSTDRDLIDLSLTDSSDPVFKISDFISKLYRRSNLCIYCQPLATGRANDLTGTLTISRGVNTIERRTVASKDYLYHINRDGNVKLFLR